MNQNLLRRMGAMLLSAALTAAWICPVRAAEEEPVKLVSRTAVLMDAETGQVLYEKDMHTPMAPASITKIMTGMLALTHLKLDDELTMSKEAFVTVPRSAAGLNLCQGEVVTVEQAMYGLTTISANDAANLLAEGVSGTMADFAVLMNEKARELGCENTHFNNPNGLLSNDHYTSAYDMALITREALKVPGFAEFFRAVHYDLPPTNLFHSTRNLANHNKMLSGLYYDDLYYDENIVMSKTGWTEEAQNTLVSALERDGTTLIAVVMYSAMMESKYIDTWALFDYGFSHYERKSVPAENLNSMLGDCTFAPDQELTYLLSTDADISEMEFTLAEDTVLTQAPEQEVTVKASLNGEALPDTVLRVEYIPPETVPEPTEAPVIEEPVKASPTGILPILTALTALALVAAVYFLRKETH